MPVTYNDFAPYLNELTRRREFIVQQLAQYESLPGGDARKAERMAYLRGEAEGIGQSERMLTDALVLLLGRPASSEPSKESKDQEVHHQLQALENLSLQDLVHEVSQLNKLN